MNIPITKEHLEGIPRSSENCPLQRALKDIVKPSVCVQVHSTQATFDFRKKRHSVSFPGKACRFVAKIDSNIKVRPTTLQLDIPTQLLKKSKKG